MPLTQRLPSSSILSTWATLAMLLVLALPMPARADPAIDVIRRSVEAFGGGRFKIDEVRRTPVPGIYEVRIQSDLVYVDEKGQYLFYSGDLIDMRSQRNLTRERVEDLLTIDFKTLPLDLAIQQKMGDGKRVIAVFEDPNCGYCRKLRADLLKLDNVTLYTFPMAFLAPDSETKASKALCAADKVRAWNDLMISNRVPGNAGTCETSLAKVAELARNLGITGTPVVFFQNGKRLQGYAPPERFIEMLNAASRG
jgi:thiol:disulfide interchange protein DsbC